MTEQHKLLNTGEKTQGKTQKQKEIENIKLDQKILLNMDDAFATDYTMSFDSYALFVVENSLYKFAKSYEFYAYTMEMDLLAMGEYNLLERFRPVHLENCDHLLYECPNERGDILHFDVYLCRMNFDHDLRMYVHLQNTESYWRSFSKINWPGNTNGLSQIDYMQSMNYASFCHVLSEEKGLICQCGIYIDDIKHFSQCKNFCEKCGCIHDTPCKPKELDRMKLQKLIGSLEKNGKSDETLNAQYVELEESLHLKPRLVQPVLKFSDKETKRVNRIHFENPLKLAHKHLKTDDIRRERNPHGDDPGEKPSENQPKIHDDQDLWVDQQDQFEMFEYLNRTVFNRYWIVLLYLVAVMVWDVLSLFALDSIDELVNAALTFFICVIVFCILFKYSYVTYRFSSIGNRFLSKNAQKMSLHEFDKSIPQFVKITKVKCELPFFNLGEKIIFNQLPSHILAVFFIAIIFIPFRLILTYLNCDSIFTCAFFIMFLICMHELFKMIKYTKEMEICLPWFKDLIAHFLFTDPEASRDQMKLFILRNPRYQVDRDNFAVYLDHTIFVAKYWLLTRNLNLKKPAIDLSMHMDIIFMMSLCRPYNLYVMLKYLLKCLLQYPIEWLDYLGHRYQLQHLILITNFLQTTYSHFINDWLLLYLQKIRLNLDLLRNLFVGIFVKLFNLFRAMLMFLLNLGWKKWTQINSVKTNYAKLILNSPLTDYVNRTIKSKPLLKLSPILHTSSHVLSTAVQTYSKYSLDLMQDSWKRSSTVTPILLNISRYPQGLNISRIMSVSQELNTSLPTIPNLKDILPQWSWTLLKSNYTDIYFGTSVQFQILLFLFFSAQIIFGTILFMQVSMLVVCRVRSLLPWAMVSATCFSFCTCVTYVDMKIFYLFEESLRAMMVYSLYMNESPLNKILLISGSISNWTLLMMLAKQLFVALFLTLVLIKLSEILFAFLRNLMLSIPQARTVAIKSWCPYFVLKFIALFVKLLRVLFCGLFSAGYFALLLELSHYLMRNPGIIRTTSSLLLELYILVRIAHRPNLRRLYTHLH